LGTPSALPGAKLALVESETEERLSDPYRRLAFRFLSLPYLDRQQIATYLQLTENTDEDLREPELSSAFLLRAKNSHRLRALWEQVDKVSGNVEDNPFLEGT